MRSDFESAPVCLVTRGRDFVLAVKNVLRAAGTQCVLAGDEELYRVDTEVGTSRDKRAQSCRPPRDRGFVARFHARHGFRAGFNRGCLEAWPRQGTARELLAQCDLDAFAERAC